MTVAEPSHPRRAAVIAALLLSLVTVALYAPAMGHGFVSYDDALYVTQNAHVSGG